MGQYPTLYLDDPYNSRGIISFQTRRVCSAHLLGAAGLFYDRSNKVSIMVRDRFGYYCSLWDNKL